METDVPETLQQTKDAFLVQCALGFRIGEFQTITMEDVAVTDTGVPYVHYLPSKTLKENDTKEEINTPIIRFALDIIKKYQFNFTIIHYPGGENGYSKKIRKLLEYCSIDRPVRRFNKETGKNEFPPIHQFASSKVGRATNEDLMRVAQVNMFTSGLHAVGSGAVRHYTQERVGELFARMCYAYGQPLYKVDNELNIIEEPK